MGEGFRSVSYIRHNARRLEHLSSLGLDLFCKSVLEVGAGIGDLTLFFVDRGCTVTAVEPRPGNLEAFRETLANSGYGSSISVRLIGCGVETLEERVQERFDIVFCYGLLYHTTDPDRVLRLLADRCAGLLLLETCVSFGDDDAINPVKEDARQPTQSFDGGACRPSRPWVFSRLRELFPFVYVPATQPVHPEFPLDWTTPSSSPTGLTRAVFIGSRHALDLPLLLDRLPTRQLPAGWPG